MDINAKGDQGNDRGTGEGVGHDIDMTWMMDDVRQEVRESGQVSVLAG